MTYNYKSFLTKDSIGELLKGDIMDVSNVTDIPLSTLKNYKNGFSNLDNMPYHMVESLTSYSESSYDPFKYPTHYFLKGDLFARLLKEVRPEYNQNTEIYNAQMLFNYASERFLVDSGFQPSIRYFFIDNLDELNEAKLPGIDFDLLFSVGLMQGIRFVINIDHVTDAKTFVQSKDGLVLSGDLVKKITRDKLDEMRELSDVKEFMVLMDDELIEKNVKLWLLHDLYSNHSDPFDYLDIWFVMILKFIKDLTDAQLVGFIMSTHDEQDVYLREYVGENEMYVTLFTMAAMKNSIVEVIHNYFDSKSYEALIAHYV
mgnify:CR=1 FL=1